MNIRIVKLGLGTISNSSMLAILATVLFGINSDVSAVAIDDNEPDDSPGAAKLTANGQNNVLSIHEAGNVDWLKFVVGSGGASDIRIETTGVPGGDTEIFLYGPGNSSNLVASDDDGGTDRYSLIERASLAAGTYYARIQEYGNDGTIGAYTFRVDWTDVPSVTIDSNEPDDSPGAAKLTANGQNNVLSIHEAGNVDWLKFVVGSGGASDVRIETTGVPGGDTKIFLCGPNDSASLVESNDDGGTAQYSLIERPSLAAGTYHVKIEKSGNNGTIGAYTLRVDWRVAVSFEIIGFVPPATNSVARGTQLEATVTVRNNTPNSGSCWVGLSFAHESADNDLWPTGFYDVAPKPTDAIAPNGGTTTVTFTFSPHKNLAPGKYFARTRTWGTFDSDSYLLSNPLDDSIDSPEQLGNLSFSLPGYPAGSNESILSQIEYAVGREFFGGSIIQSRYHNGDKADKPLLAVAFGLDDLDFNLPLLDVPVNLGGSILIDLADLFYVTPEGSDTVTVWIDADGALKYQFAGIPGPVDISVIPHSFRFQERALADKRAATFVAGQAIIPGMTFTRLSCELDGCEEFKLEWNGSARLQLTAFGLNAPLVAREVSKQRVLDLFIDDCGIL